MNPLEEQKSDLDESFEASVRVEVTGSLGNQIFSRDSTLVKATCLYSILVLVVIIAVFHIFENTTIDRLTADLRVALPVVQLAYATVAFRLFGTPKSTREFAVVTFMHAFLLWNYWLLHRNLHGIAVTYFLEFLLRLSIIGGWLFLAIGAMTLVHVLWQGRRRHPFSGRILKATFATAVILLPLELTSSAIEGRRKAPLPLTIDLPARPEIHIATIGGSTMRGFPYDANYGIGRIVHWQLQRLFPDEEFVLDNVAVTGINLEQAIGRINEATGFPDILIVYSGHNEFFHNTEGLALSRRTHWAVVDDFARQSPLFRLLHGYLAQHAALPMPSPKITSVCGTRLCPDYVMQERLEAYGGHLGRLYEWANKNDIQVVHCVPASGDTNLAPNISMANRSSADNIAKRWTTIRTLRNSGELFKAIDAARQAVASYPLFAEFHYLLGMSLRDAKKSREALEHFVLARDLDQRPLRCLSAWQNEGIRVANENSIPVVQSEAILRAISPDGILDETLFLDGVHPNLRATFAIAEKVTDTIITNGFDRMKTASYAKGNYSDCLLQLGVNAQVLADAYSQTADVWNHYARFRSFPDQERESQAAIWSLRAEGLRVGNIKPGEGGVELLRAAP